MSETDAIDVVALAAELIAIPSVSGDEGRVVAYIERWLAARGWRVSIQEVSPGRGNLWALRDHELSGSAPAVTLSTHLDTVPPHVPPRVEGPHLFGRGACDAKGIAAAMLAAADGLARRGEDRVGLLFVVGEERGSDGAVAARALTDGLPPARRFLINGEPTESRLATGAKGSLRVLIRTAGREAHSAYPALGCSAIDSLVRLLSDLPELSLPSDPVLGETTINVGVIRGGTAANIIAGSAEAELLVRLVGDVEAVRCALDSWAAGRATLTYGTCIPPQYFHTVPGYPTAPVAFTSDIPLLDAWGVPLLVGPGSIHVAHTPDEFIGIDELRDSVAMYRSLAETLLAGVPS